MKFLKSEDQGNQNNGLRAWLPENTIQIEKRNLRYVVDKICRKGECRYPLLALRILIHVITEMENSGKIHISARQLSKSLDAHYDTVTKCLKYLRDIEVLSIEK